MKSRIEIIEEAIARVYRRIERIEALFDAGEYKGEIAEAETRQAFDELSELQDELDEHLRREDEAINWGSPRDNHEADWPF